MKMGVNLRWNLLVCGLLLAATSQICLAQNYKVCAGVAHSLTNCQGVETGGSSVSCTSVTDNIDCAVKLANGQADFGVFTAEEALLLAQQQPNAYQVLGSIRHQDKLTETFAFQTVALVRSTHTGGLAGLRNGGYCHPGFGTDDPAFSTRVLQTFEKAVASECPPNARTPAESSVSAVDSFFSAGCRPGTWSADPVEDARLKNKYNKLCSICGSLPDTSNQFPCTYGFQNTSQAIVSNQNRHIQAIDCLVNGPGNVSYVAWDHVREYFQSRPDASNFALLCPNGTLASLPDITTGSTFSTVAPCAWVRQPWSALVARTQIASALLPSFSGWLPTGVVPNPGTWVAFLNAILFSEPSLRLSVFTATKTISEYIQEAREIPNLETDTSRCHAEQRWCTNSAEAATKCLWARHAAFSLGLEPTISCATFNSSVECLNQIQGQRADFTSIDSNYGYLARQYYGLSSVLYHQTQNRYASRVFALLKESHTLENITRFENLRDKVACFPEYGGIAWVSFVRIAHERGIISDSECNYARAAADFFAGACAPGASNGNYRVSSESDVNALCSACRSTIQRTDPDPFNINEQGVAGQNSLVCAADHSNLYYGTNGTLSCLASDSSHVAFIEQQYLADAATQLRLNASSFRVLCRNNTLATSPGFDVDDDCLLVNVVDGEVVARRNWESTDSLKGLMLQLNELFGYNAGSNKLIDLKIFSPFNGIPNLLFKDTTIGFATSDSQNQQVVNYNELFRHLDACNAAPAAAGPAQVLSLLLVAAALLLATL